MSEEVGSVCERRTGEDSQEGVVAVLERKGVVLYV